MSKLKRVIFEYEDSTFIAEGAEAEKWQSNFDQQIAWANVENNNYFRNNPVKFEIYPDGNPCCKIKMKYDDECGPMTEEQLFGSADQPAIDIPDTQIKLKKKQPKNAPGNS